MTANGFTIRVVAPFIPGMAFSLASRARESGVSWADGGNVFANASFENGVQPAGPSRKNADGVMSLP